ncbi:DNA polymerase subunit beta [Methanospirillum sp.]|uniref:DNA polymerase subunit beta n=1 Tax=Methanospirillum sp. TaxID=45200 RepID=UPI0035A016A0
MVLLKPVRLRDFVRDVNGWYYAVAAYDNFSTIGSVLRYIPDPSGDRIDDSKTRYRKVEFEEAYHLISKHHPEWSGLVHRIPLNQVKKVLKPDEEIERIKTHHTKVAKLVKALHLPPCSFGVTGSLLCGLEGKNSDIDGVVYGSAFGYAQKQLARSIKNGTIKDLSESLWKTVYKKRNPYTSYEEFILHEKRKQNRGQVDGTYFDLLYTRSYSDLPGFSMHKGVVLGKNRIEATVTADQFAFDSPAVYEIDHPEISRVLSFTHTYTGQAFTGERLEAQGIVEQHGKEKWLVVGTTREAKGEFIRSLSLLEKEG